MSQLKVPNEAALSAIAELLYVDTSGVLRWAAARGNRAAHTVAGSLGRDGYVDVKTSVGRFKGHRIAWYLSTGTWPILPLDHINRDRADNRPSNLRVVDLQANARNRSPYVGRTSAYKGVSLQKHSGKWQAKITINRKQIHLGQYDDEELAALVYEEAAAKYFGEHAACHSEIVAAGIKRVVYTHEEGVKEYNVYS
jgi:hypothetical protein